MRLVGRFGGMSLTTWTWQGPLKKFEIYVSKSDQTIIILSDSSEFSGTAIILLYLRGRYTIRSVSQNELFVKVNGYKFYPISDDSGLA